METQLWFRSITFLLVLVGVLPEWAQAQAAPLAQSPAVSYDIRDLHPVGYSFHRGDVATRYFFRLQNEQGSHYLVYEEFSAISPVKEMKYVERFSNNPDHVCTLELDCSLKAICVNDCKSLYYETTNAPLDPSMKDRNNCSIRSFGCLAKSIPLETPAANTAIAVNPVPPPAANLPT